MAPLSQVPWRSFALRGLVALAFGVAAFAAPHVTLTALILAFGAFAIADGALLLAAARDLPRALRGRRHFVRAGVSIAIGAVAVVWPHMTARLLVSLIGGWAVLTGAIELLLATSVPEGGDRRLLQGLGAVSVVIGVLLLGWPTVAAGVLMTVLGAYAVLVGLTLVSLGVRLRKLRALGR